jgi:hypothetical protein
VKEGKESKLKKILIEVCCFEQSRLSTKYQQRGGRAIRVSLPNHDFSKEKTTEGLVRAIEVLKEEGFEAVFWFSIPCSAWCSWQRVNLKMIEGFKEKLEEKKE